MKKLGRVFKDYKESGALNELVGVHAVVDPRTFMTKAGDLLTVLRLQAADHECLDAEALNQIARRFETSQRVLDESLRVYQYIVKRDHAAVPAEPCDVPVVKEAIANRAAYFQQRSHELYTTDLYFAVVYEGWRGIRDARRQFTDLLEAPLRGLRERFSPLSTIHRMNGELARARDLLAHAVTNFIVQMPESVPLQVLSIQEAYHFLRSLVNYAPHKVSACRLLYDRYVDYQMCDTALECHPDHLRLDDYFVTVLTLKQPPSQTFANVLRELQAVGCNLLVTSEWKRDADLTVRRLIQSKRRHFHNTKTSMLSYLPTSNQDNPQDRLTDDSAVAHVSELGACLQELEVKGRHFGQYSLTIVVYHQDRSVVRRAAAECMRVLGTHDGQLLEERYNQLNAWLAIIPGNSAYNLRRLWITDANYADLSFLFASKSGEPRNAHLRSEYLAVLETNQKGPYFLNLHYLDVAHALILGATGSGKSFLLNFLLTHLQKYRPITFIFDLGGSYKHLTSLFGGVYWRLGVSGEGLRINPFVLPSTPDNRQFLFSFVKVLIESGGDRMSSDDERDLYAQIENIYVIEPDQRRLSTLANMLTRASRQRLEKWVSGGPFGSVFDNVEDNLTFARFQAFDFAAIEKVPEVVEPFLFYVLHRASEAIAAPAEATAFKVFVVDEAWRFLRHPTTQRYILEALRTWRKMNAAMMLATQSTDDLLRSEMLNVVVESCPTKMFLANPGLDLKLYREIFHLNETEANWIARLTPKQQFLLKQPDLAKVINLHVDRRDYWLYTSNPYDRERRRQAIEEHGLAAGLDLLVRSEAATGGTL